MKLVEVYQYILSDISDIQLADGMEGMQRIASDIGNGQPFPLLSIKPCLKIATAARVNLMYS